LNPAQKRGKVKEQKQNSNPSTSPPAADGTGQEFN